MRWLLVLLLLATTALADPVIESKQYLNHSAGEILVGYQFKVGATGPGGIVYSFVGDEVPGTSYNAFQFSDYGATRFDSLQLLMNCTWGAGHFSVSPIVGDSFIIVAPGRSNVIVKRYNIFTNTVEDSASYGLYSSDELLAQPMYVDDTTVLLLGRNYTTAGVNPFWAISYDKGATFALGGGPISVLTDLSGDANMRVGITRNGDSTVVGFFYQPNSIYSAIFNYGDYWPDAFVDTIAASGDDAGYSTAGAWSNSTTDHYVGFNYVDGFDDIPLGGLTLLFTGVPVSQGAIIDSAFIGLTCQGILGGGDSLYIRAEDTADATAFSSTENDAIIDRAWDAASAARTTSMTIDSAGIIQYTDDISSCVQMVVDRADWAAGNDMAFRIDGLTLSAGENHLLRIRSGDYTGTASDPRLIVYYHDPDAAWDNFGADSSVFTSALLKRKMSMTTSLDGGTYLSCSDTAGYIMVACKDSGAADFRIDTVSVLGGVPFEANNGPITALTCDQWTNKVTLAYTDADSIICIKQYDPATQTWGTETKLATGQVQNIAGFNTTDPSFGARWLFSYRRAVATDTCFTMVLYDAAATEWGAAPANTGRIIIIGN